MLTQVFDMVKLYFKKHMPEVGEVYLWDRCPYAEYDHHKSSRSFAHTNHADHVVCTCTALHKRKPEEIAGVLLHEFGHIAAMQLGNDGSEEAADRIILECLDIPIRYTRRDAVQYITREDLQKIYDYSLPINEWPTSFPDGYKDAAIEVASHGIDIGKKFLASAPFDLKTATITEMSDAIIDALEEGLEKKLDDSAIFLRSAKEDEEFHFLVIEYGGHFICVQIPIISFKIIQSGRSKVIPIETSYLPQEIGNRLEQY